MQSIKSIDVHRDIQCYNAETKELESLSYYNKHHMHLLVRKLIHPMHVFEYDQVVIYINWTDKKKLYKATFDVLLLNNKRVKYSVKGIKLSQGTYAAYIKESHLND